jgi:pimeloyl-ACP methyl ester carboxylesterase
VTSFVLIPGAWHGSWCYEPIAHELSAHGHDVRSLTLTGLSKGNGPSPANLDTHIQDVVRTIEARRIQHAVLCGHSYGGMVITGAADRVPERVARLVYVDAYVPAHGDSCWSLTTDRFREWFITGARADGCAVAPLPGMDPRANSHPLPSLLQAIRLGDGVDRVRTREFIYLTGWGPSPFEDTYTRLRDEPGWRVHRVDSGHNILSEAPDQLLPILLADPVHGG